MTLKFNKTYFAFFTLLLVVEIAIAIFLKEGFIRHTFGDYLVVILMYTCIKSFSNIKPLAAAVGVLLFAFNIEFLQLFNLLDVLNLRDSHLAKLILGSTFHISDLIAYTLGVLTILCIEHLKTSKS
ncbi:MULTISPECIES: DUF2809 domain-containing protein [Flavobacteriaceae]|uniref:Uncharacterized protein DUF2809 n=1 Tax=Meridianimaribacter flavus TaxID=571115 RepID=A0ABY2G8T7_9FLAO|nr:DUF2809 domain-containing protein [Meridianimaribacter flavus]TDY14207.1 uncharacterized protein DUF2809 [Meridianimaribacter flavus]